MNWFNALKERMSGGGVKAGSGATASDNKESKESGFTIVEVMIVLAIAGLVLGIVFIAVPALQRNSRNTQRRADLGGLRAQVDTWTANNNGKIPSDANSNDMDSIIGSTGWGHYNGNADEPTVSVIPSTVVAYTDSEHRITYAKDLTATEQVLLELPSRQEIHVLGEMACVQDILTNGNDTDGTSGTPGKYAASNADVIQSSARAIAYVYQIEGEDRARCEDNV